MPHHTATKGNIGVALVTADLLDRGYDVSVPVCSTSPFDLLIYKAPGKFWRVQVKYRLPKNGFLGEVSCLRHSLDGRRYAKARANEEIDVVAVCDGDSRRIYYLPAPFIGVRRLRISPARNGQAKGVRLASDFRDLEAALAGKNKI